MSDTIFGFPKYPDFDPSKPRFPTETFLGRYLNYLDIIDPRTLVTSNAEIKKSLELLKNYDSGNLKSSGSTNEDLWKARKIKQAIFHPDTGEKVFAPFRMSGYVPFGWITVTGMLLPNPSWPTLLFWQWMNQSHNAAVNYANRNATNPQPSSVYVKAYGAAVSTAIGVSAGLTWLIRRSGHLSPTTKLIVQRFVPLPATALASVLNVICMRAPELDTGIDVFDESGIRIGTSKIAAKHAIIDTAYTRIALVTQLLAVPPCIMPFFEKLRWVQRSARNHLVVNAIVCTLSFGISLPIALALFPQQSTIARGNLEKEIQAATRADVLVYNKGL